MPSGGRKSNLLPNEVRAVYHYITTTKGLPDIIKDKITMFERRLHDLDLES